MFNARFYGFWGALIEALRTGEPQSEAKQGGDVFAINPSPFGRPRCPMFNFSHDTAETTSVILM